MRWPSCGGFPLGTNSGQGMEPLPVALCVATDGSEDWAVLGKRRMSLIQEFVLRLCHDHHLQCHHSVERERIPHGRKGLRRGRRNSRRGRPQRAKAAWLGRVEVFACFATTIPIHTPCPSTTVIAQKGCLDIECGWAGFLCVGHFFFWVLVW